MYFVGLAVGGPLFGWAADAWGRKPALFAATALAAVTTGLGAIAPNYWVHFVSRVTAS